MRKVLLIIVFFMVKYIANSQDLTCDTTGSKRKWNYGISIGFIFFQYAQPGSAPAKWFYSTNYYKDGLSNLFYEQRFFLPVAEFCFNNKVNFHQLVGGSFSFRKFYNIGGSGRSDSVYYRGIYLYYQNKLLLRKYTKIRFLKNFYTGGRFIITGKEMVNYYEFHNGPNQNGEWIFTDKNIMGALGFTLGYKKFWERFFWDIGINRTIFALGIGEYFPNFPYLVSKGPENKKYFSIMSPFGESFLRPLEKNFTPITFYTRIGFQFSKK